MPLAVDVVRSIYAAWERGDYSSADWAHPEIEWVLAADGPARSEGKGLGDMADVWREYISPFEGFHHEVDEYVEVDSERVLVLQHFSGHGKTSGVDLARVPSQGAVLFHVRDGRVTRLVGYFDRDRALSDLGLAPEASSSNS